MKNDITEEKVIAYIKKRSWVDVKDLNIQNYFMTGERIYTSILLRLWQYRRVR